MRQKFWFNSDSDYGGPYGSAEEAMEEAVKASKPTDQIEIHQLVFVSPVPTRTWRKR
jgi:hypothetical protein